MTILDYNPKGDTHSFANDKMRIHFPRITTDTAQHRKNNWQYPTRTGNDIHVPFQPMVQYFQLDQGNSVLIQVPDESYGGATFWLCGDPENPFLSQVTKDAVNVYYQTGSEAIFWHNLKPSAIQSCEKHFQLKARRQGCLYACSLGNMPWEELDRAFLLTTGQAVKKLETPPTGRYALFETEHFLTGKYANHSLFGQHQTLLVVASGTIVGPDEQSMELDTPHLVCVSNGFVPG